MKTLLRDRNRYRRKTNALICKVCYPLTCTVDYTVPPHSLTRWPNLIHRLSHVLIVSLPVLRTQPISWTSSHSLAHSPTYSLAHSLTNSLTHSFRQRCLLVCIRKGTLKGNWNIYLEVFRRISKLYLEGVSDSSKSTCFGGILEMVKEG